MSYLKKIGFSIVPLAILAFYNNCSKVAFSTPAVTQGSSNGAAGSPSSGGGSSGNTPPLVQLSPLVNAVAFEDLYYPPGTTCTNCPDFDYNDFLTEFQIQEVANAQNNLTDIYIDFYPRAVGAGYDHIFSLSLTGVITTAAANSKILPVTSPMFNGSAVVTLTYYDQNGDIIGQPTNPAYNQDIVVFPSTHAIFGDGTTGGGNIINTTIPSGYSSGVPSSYVPAKQNARIHIVLDNPAANPAPANGLIDPSTFRVTLHPISTNYIIDIINVDPTNFAGSSGYPWGFIIPTDWQWMTEGVKINSGYPEITQYGDFLLGQPATGNYLNWFNAPIQPATPQVLYPSVPWTPFLPAIP